MKVLPLPLAFVGPVSELQTLLAADLFSRRGTELKKELFEDPLLPGSDSNKMANNFELRANREKVGQFSCATTLSITAFSMTTFSVTTLKIMTFSITIITVKINKVTLCIMTLRIKTSGIV
jgi:hypothetical protein